MEQKFYKIFRKSIAARLLLLVSLLVGGGDSVVADEIVKETILSGYSFDENTWTNSNFNIGSSDISYTGWGSASLTSKKAKTIAANTRLKIKAKRGTGSAISIDIKNADTSSSLCTFYYHNSKNKYDIYSDQDYVELISNILPEGTYKIQISVVGKIYLNSIKLVENAELLLDENQLTAITTGAKSENVTFKYTPKTGWNTICVPFQLKYASYWEHLTNIFGSEWQAFTFNSLSAGVIQFSNATPNSYNNINANVPLLVYAPNGDTQAAANPDGFTLSSNVTIAYSNEESARATTANGVTFQGTYAPIAAGAESALVGNYGITNAGQIVNAGANSSIKGYRAYLTGLGGAGARIMILDDESNTPTDIGLFKMAVPEAKDVYTLSGQRVQKARKGIYVINGKKIVIK